jgi:hypothetical protein
MWCSVQGTGTLFRGMIYGKGEYHTDKTLHSVSKFEDLLAYNLTFVSTQFSK